MRTSLNLYSDERIIFKSATDFIKNLYPYQYLEWVARELNCLVSELRVLQPHPDFNEEDNSGTHLKSFFPRGTKIRTAIVKNEEKPVCSNFNLPEVRRVYVNGRKIICDFLSSKSSKTVWINVADLW